ncbi:MAG: hypothetical protein H6767_09665 [Candidatus Peribacteria bacterium]|nr:MAG: hypothetical protein H6767_09665 [Candidatus Peribacteria bacterium]
MLTNYGGDYFVSLDGDIEVLYDGGSISEKSIVYDTLSELAEFHYQYRKDYNNYVFYGIRQTKA